MARPAAGYETADGARCPGVTTIISSCKLGGVEGLLYWANQEGLAGRNHRETRDAAADAGTCCHEMVEAYIHKAEFDASKYKPETLAKAEGAYHAFLQWAEQSKLEAFETEQSLVSETHKFGGTLDALFIQGKLSMGDWKTSNSIHVDYLCQLAAYQILWEENYPDMPITGGFHLIRFNKPTEPDDPVSFTHHFWSDLNLAKEAFLYMRRLYDINARLKKIL